MLRAALAAAAVLLALPASAAAAGGSVALDLCAPRERAAEFEARMSRIPGAARMKMRFLLESRKAGARHYHRVSAPGFSRWTSSRAGRYVFTRRVEALEGPARYRAQVRFQWLDDRGHVIARDRAWSRSCRQGDHRANLRLRWLEAMGRRYVATVANTGRSDSGSFALRLTVDGLETSVGVASLAPGETREVELLAARCRQSAAAFADPLDLVDERSETDNERAITC
jgi:hypothetical protein